MINFVTSMNEEGYNLYGKKMLDSVKEYWDDSLHLTCFYHDFDMPEENTDRVTFRNLNVIEDMLTYRDAMKPYDGTHGGKTEYNWRMDSIKWCHKVFALTEFSFELMERDHHWLFWLDADTITTKPFNKNILNKFCDFKKDLIHLGRKDTDYSETSFLGFNLTKQGPCELLGDIRGAYISGEVLGYREWHDGFIIERLLNIHKAHGLKAQNLTPLATGLDAFGQSPVNSYMTHFKGNRKLSRSQTSPDVVGPKRYGQLATLIRHYDINKIVEVGTWNGGRAIEMALAAFEHHDVVEYWGFDLFEEATEESDKVELNTKAHNTIDAVNSRLDEFSLLMEKKGKTFIHQLYQGDTKETLKDFDTKGIDFAYIDGGHSFETCNSDWEALSSIPLVVFDDFFSKDANGVQPPEEHCGTNQVITNLSEDKENKWNIKVLPSSDPVLGGGTTHLAVVYKDGMPDIPEDLRKVPIVISPRDCMPVDYIHNNINTNVKLLTEKDWNWIENCGMATQDIILVSGGPFDVDELSETIKERPTAIIVCVKHSFPVLMKHGIVPDYCVILDPRPIDGISTHGIKRKDLFIAPLKETTFLVASMTDTSVFNHLLGLDAKIKGWHAYSDAIRNPDVQDKLAIADGVNIHEGAVLVTGGTCAALRAFGMFHILGFRNFIMYGFSGSYTGLSDEEIKEAKDEHDRTKYLTVETDGDKFVTTGELLAMAQDCEKLFDRHDIDFSIEFHGEDSLCEAVWRTSRKAKETYWEDIL
jgi:predicted O-methyltransferase YrrM